MPIRSRNIFRIPNIENDEFIFFCPNELKSCKEFTILETDGYSSLREGDEYSNDNVKTLKSSDKSIRWYALTEDCFINDFLGPKFPDNFEPNIKVYDVAAVYLKGENISFILLPAVRGPIHCISSEEFPNKIRSRRFTYKVSTIERQAGGSVFLRKLNQTKQTVFITEKKDKTNKNSPLL